MSFKPVDFQVMIPKAAEISKIHNDNLFKNSAVQQQISSATQNKAESDLKQVNSRDKPQDVQINERQARNGRGGGEEKHPKEERKNGKKTGKYGEYPTSTIDIKI